MSEDIDDVVKRLDEAGYFANKVGNFKQRLKNAGNGLMSEFGNRGAGGRLEIGKGVLALRHQWEEWLGATGNKPTKESVGMFITQYLGSIIDLNALNSIFAKAEASAQQAQPQAAAPEAAPTESSTATPQSSENTTLSDSQRLDQLIEELKAEMQKTPLHADVVAEVVYAMVRDWRAHNDEALKLKAQKILSKLVTQRPDVAPMIPNIKAYLIEDVTSPSNDTVLSDQMLNAIWTEVARFTYNIKNAAQTNDSNSLNKSQNQQNLSNNQRGRGNSTQNGNSISFDYNKLGTALSNEGLPGDVISTIINVAKKSRDAKELADTLVAKIRDKDILVKALSIVMAVATGKPA